MIRWAWIVIDRPEPTYGAATGFWATATGTVATPPFGRRGELVRLEPPAGDPMLLLQAVPEDEGGAHLDLGVDDVADTVAVARRLGASLEADHGEWSTLRSPGGMPFCLFTWAGQSRRPPALTSPTGATSRLDQVCLDLAEEVYDAEVRFWADLTGWDLDDLGESEFVRLTPADQVPGQMLLQRLAEPRATSAHLDLACSDREATRRWHEELGARTVEHFPHWTVMEDPAGATYCLTVRRP